MKSAVICGTNKLLAPVPDSVLTRRPAPEV